MDRYIGIDAHATSCTLVVIGPSGRKLNEHVLETNASALVECIQSIPRPRHLCLEEGNQSAWLHQVLSPHVDELVVAGTSEKRKDHKSDRRDALARAQELRLGAFEKIVFKAPNQFALLRHLAWSYDSITRDVVRTQCRLRALYLSRGLHSASKTLYGTHRDQWLGKLPTSCQPSAQMLYAELDAQRELSWWPSRIGIPSAAS
jgi:hypothetical protein